MSLAIATAATFAIGLAAAFAAAPRDGFETEIFIAASPERVWSLLTDPVEHAAWNPAMHTVEGRFSVGERLRLRMRTPSGGAISFRPRVLLAEPARELRWLGRLGLPRLFDGEHYFRLIREDDGTRLIHGERFRGVLLWAMGVHQFRPVFEAANAALKARAEAASAIAPTDAPPAYPLTRA
ncbi:MAG: SRPBCC domain-containing protein [Salinarimonas sp.]|nr:SRPBCC domain-containing protein [Salinarimonas sp.]